MVEGYLREHVMEHMRGADLMLEPLEDVIGSVDCAQSAAHPGALVSVVVESDARARCKEQATQ